MNTAALLRTGVMILLFIPQSAGAWGFYAHRLINRMAVFALPPEMIGFYKKHIEYLCEHAVDPDKRSRGVEGEDKKHYIDLDRYGNMADSLPVHWNEAQAMIHPDTLEEHGINPWWIGRMMFSLTEAFRSMNAADILYVSANLGHYTGDACTPLHTTRWYDGKTIQQKGIHAFWETRVPELFANGYRFLTGRAVYIEDPSAFAWMMVRKSHAAVDTIFRVTEQLAATFPPDKMYSYEDKGGIVRKQFSREYTLEFNRLTSEMVQKQLITAVHAVASLWYTAWVNAGQPDLSLADDRSFIAGQARQKRETEKMWRTGKVKHRKNPEETEKP